MPERQAQAEWNGSLQEGSGSMRLGSGAFEGAYSFKSRFEEGTGTNPEELIAAAHAGCFSMALAAGLGRGGHEPTRVRTTAKVHLTRGDEGFSISRIDLVTTADVPGIAEGAFREVAETAKRTCPVSKALAGTEITLDAKLES